MILKGAEYCLTKWCWGDEDFGVVDWCMIVGDSKLGVHVVSQRQIYLTAIAAIASTAICAHV